MCCCTQDRSQRSLARTTGKRVVHQRSFQHGGDVEHQRVMKHSIAKASGPGLPLGLVVDLKAGPVPIRRAAFQNIP